MRWQSHGSQPPPTVSNTANTPTIALLIGQSEVEGGGSEAVHVPLGAFANGLDESSFTVGAFKKMEKNRLHKWRNRGKGESIVEVSKTVYNVCVGAPGCVYPRARVNVLYRIALRMCHTVCASVRVYVCFLRPMMIASSSTDRIRCMPCGIVSCTALT